MEPDGDIVRSFGDEGTYRRDRPETWVRLLAAASTDQVWSGRIDRIEIQRWSTAGEKDLTLLHEPSWFLAPEDRPLWDRSAVTAIWPADDGEILWLSATTPVTEDPAGDRYALNENFDTVVSAIDVPTHRVLARARVDPRLGRALPPYVVSLRYDDDYDLFIDVWEPVLHRGPPSMTRRR